MTTQHKALGRGIGALIPTGPISGTAPGRAPTPREEAERTHIPLDSIIPNPDQPRRVFEPSELETLAGSIRRHGLLQPIVVRSVGDRYELLCGERRWRASSLAGLLSIPAVIKDIDQDDRLELALVENVQRADLNPIELAHAFKALGEAGSTQEEIGQRVGLDRSTVANHLRLLELPREFQADIEAGKFTIGHAKTLLSVGTPERRRHLRDRIVRESLSVRASEILARADSAPKRQKVKSPRTTDPNRQRLIDSLRRRYQTSVRISGDDTRGRIEIEYFGTEDLGRITEILMGGH